MERIRAAWWSLGIIHRARHQAVDESIADLGTKDRADQESLAQLHQEAGAMKRRLKAIEDRQNMLD